MEGLQPYPAYKESGLPWLGRVPAYWEAHCLRTLTRIRNERNRPELPLLSVLREKGVVPRSSLAEDENHNFIPDDLSNYKVAREGSLVINKMKAWQGSMGISPCDGIVSPAYYVFDFHIADRRYGQWLLRSRPYADFFARMSDGVRIGQWDLSISGMRQIPLPVPSSEEQSAIVRYLDHATRKIDKAIRAKRKIIALLNEQKQAIIHRAVTRGLDPDVPLKDSGIPWLGKVPTHWELHHLWSISRMRTERNPGSLDLLSVFLDRGVIRYEDGGGQVHAPSLDLSNYQVVRTGDFVLNNQQAWRGSVGVSRYDGIISPAYIILELGSRFDSSFANYLLRGPTMVAQYLAASKGVGDIQRQIYWPYLRRVVVPIPPNDEQKSIARFLETSTRGLFDSVGQIEREIYFLREYRTRLIADVVTGKLDVREAAARLPEPEAEATPEVAEVEDDEEALEEAA